MSILDDNIIDQTDIIKYNMPDIDTLVYDPQSNKSNLNIHWTNKYIFKDIENISFTLCERFSYFNTLSSKKNDWCLILGIDLSEKYTAKSITFVFKDKDIGFSNWKSNIQRILDNIYNNPHIINSWIQYVLLKEDVNVDLGFLFGFIEYITFEEFMKIR